MIYLNMLDKIQKLIFSSVGTSLAASLKTLAHRRNVASVSLFFRYYSDRSSSELELVDLVPRPHSRERSTTYSNRLHDFPVNIRRSYEDIHVNNFFLHTAGLWNYFPAECFHWTCDPNGFMSRVKRYIFFFGSF